MTHSQILKAIQIALIEKYMFVDSELAAPKLIDDMQAIYDNLFAGFDQKTVCTYNDSGYFEVRTEVELDTERFVVQVTRIEPTQENYIQ